jgi:hypothetical protein
MNGIDIVEEMVKSPLFIIDCETASGFWEKGRTGSTGYYGK